MDKQQIARVIIQSVQTVPDVLPLLSEEARLFVHQQTVKTSPSTAYIIGEYNNAITQILFEYFERSGSAAVLRNQFKREMVEAFGSMFDLGWSDGGGVGVPNPAALQWYNARIDAELSYINQLFQQARELRGEEGFDAAAWIAERAEGYANTLRAIYNNARVRAMKPSLMVTFDGDDGAKPCKTCRKLKGQRHRLSWFISHDYVPPFGGGLDCSKGGQCLHNLTADSGEVVTV